MAAASGLGAGASPAGAATVPALSAAAYRDSVGVQMHHSFAGYAYDQEPASTLAADLRAIGVRHVRDSVCLNVESVCARVRTKMASLRGAFGPDGPPVDLLLQYSLELKSQPGRAQRDADIERGLTAAAAAPLAGMVAGLEAVNEPDLKGVDGWTQSVLADDATATRLLAEPRFAGLRAVPRLTPAIGHPENTAALMSAGWTGARADTPNFHPYPPAWGGPENGLTTPCSGGDVLGCARGLGAGGAPIASESGYSTAGGPTSQGWVSEQAQAIYLPRLLLENFSRGVARTYLYELIDLDPSRASTTNGFGLWHAQQVGATMRQADPKPAATALSRLQSAIGDLGAAVAPTTPLDITLTRGGTTVGNDTVRRVLLQRADGSYALALWQPKAVFNNALLAQRDVAVPDASIDVTLGNAVAGGWTAAAFRPTLGGDTLARASAASRFTVPVGPDVTLIDLRTTTPGAAILPAPATSDDAPRPATATSSSSSVSSVAGAARLGDRQAAAQAKPKADAKAKARAKAKRAAAKAKAARARAKAKARAARARR